MSKVAILGRGVFGAVLLLGGMLAGAAHERQRCKDRVNPDLVAYDLLDCAMKENAKYEELREYAEVAYNVRKEALSGEGLPEDVRRQFIDEARHETMEAVKHAHARDALIAFYNTAPYITEKVSWPRGSEFEEVYLADGHMKHSRSKVHARQGMPS